MVTRFFAFFAALFILGCTSLPHPEGKPLPDMTFVHYPSFSVNARDVQIHINNIAVTERFLISIEDLMLSYLHERFIPAGENSKVLTVSVEDINVTQRYEPSEKGYMSSMKVGGRNVYDISLTVSLSQPTGVGKTRSASSDIRVTRTLKLSQHLSIAERETAQFKATEDLFSDLQEELSAIFSKNDGIRAPAR